MSLHETNSTDDFVGFCDRQPNIHGLDIQNRANSEGMPNDLTIAAIHTEIGSLVIRFPLLHYEECARMLKQWLQQCNIPGKLWRLSTKYDDEDFILSDRLEQQGCFESITENGTRYSVVVFGKIFDNLSSQGLTPNEWVNDFTSLSNEFNVEIMVEF